VCRLFSFSFFFLFRISRLCLLPLIWWIKLYIKHFYSMTQSVNLSDNSITCTKEVVFYLAFVSLSLSVCLSVCLSVWEQLHVKPTDRIFTKLEIYRVAQKSKLLTQYNSLLFWATLYPSTRKNLLLNFGSQRPLDSHQRIFTGFFNIAREGTFPPLGSYLWKKLTRSSWKLCRRRIFGKWRTH